MLSEGCASSSGIRTPSENCRKLAEVADQHYVALQVALGEEQLLPIARPRKIKDEAGGEVR
jgi:hypothetical protein